MQEKNEEEKVTEEILQYKKTNTRNNAIIACLIGVLLVVCAVVIYVRFF